jgi:hypothetical protein
MRVEFEVEGPPIKREEKSMWARDDQAPYVALLREKALAARTREGIDECFNTFVSLDLTVCVPRSEIERVGGLDNFLTGVCDGLWHAA